MVISHYVMVNIRKHVKSALEKRHPYTRNDSRMNTATACKTLDERLEIEERNLVEYG